MPMMAIIARRPFAVVVSSPTKGGGVAHPSTGHATVRRGCRKQHEMSSVIEAFTVVNVMTRGVQAKSNGLVDC
jgi:hypothetical protein